MASSFIKTTLAFFGVVFIGVGAIAYFWYLSYEKETGKYVNLTSKDKDASSLQINAENKNDGRKGNWWFDVDKIDGKWVFTYGTKTKGKVTERIWKDGKWQDVEPKKEVKKMPTKKGIKSSQPKD